jgi:hypothetical protein
MGSKRILSGVSETLTGFFGHSHRSARQEKPTLSLGNRTPEGGFGFKLQVRKGLKYEVQASPNLETFPSISTGKSTGEPIDYLDTDAPKYSQRFYRVLADGFISESVIGYVTLNVPPGYSMIANPLRTPLDAVGILLPGMPEGTGFNRYYASLSKLTENVVKDGRWTNPNETLSPGEGAVFFNPTPRYRAIHLSGEVQTGSLVTPVAADFAIYSSKIPRPGRLDSDLGFPLVEGDVVHHFDCDKQQYAIYEYRPDNGKPNLPIIGVGESFWVKKNAPAHWMQQLDMT